MKNIYKYNNYLYRALQIFIGNYIKCTKEEGK